MAIHAGVWVLPVKNHSAIKTRDSAKYYFPKFVCMKPENDTKSEQQDGRVLKIGLGTCLFSRL